MLSYAHASSKENVTISIEQKATARNPRSTVGTVTEIHDYFRLLFAHIGKPHCWKCGKLVEKQTVQQIVDTILKFKKGSKIHILAPLVRGRKGEHKSLIDKIRKDGFLRIRIDGEVLSIDQKHKLNKNRKKDKKQERYEWSNRRTTLCRHS